jgi:hypothetical protein
VSGRLAIILALIFGAASPVSAAVTPALASPSVWGIERIDYGTSEGACPVQVDVGFIVKPNVGARSRECEALGARELEVLPR